MKSEKYKQLEQYEAPCVVVAHPDDETISSTQLILHFNNKINVVFVTGSDGREQEARIAMSIAGLSESDNLHFLSFPESSIYKHCDSIRRKLAELLSFLQSDIIITHAFEGGHFDHDLVRFLIEKVLREDHVSPLCTLAQFALYYCKDGEFHHNQFIDTPKSDICLPPDDHHVDLKRRMMAAYRSQKLHFFNPENIERVRIYDGKEEIGEINRFLQRPHSGTIGYDHGIDKGKNWDLFVKTVKDNL